MTLKAEQAYISGRGSIYMTFTVTDTTYSGMTFRWATKGLVPDNASAPPASGVVISWGSLRKFMDIEGSQSGSDTTIELDALGYTIPSNGTRRFTVIQLLREVNLRDALVTFYQWNEGSTIQEVIWSGYWDRILEYRHDNFYPKITVAIRPRLLASETPISDVVTDTTFAGHPTQSTGLMIPRAYGDGRVTVTSGTDWMPYFLMGYPMPGMPGVMTDFTPFVYFAKADGTSAATEFANAGASTPTSKQSVFIYDQSLRAAAVVDKAYVPSLTNSTAYQVIQSSLEIYVWAPLRPNDPDGTNNQFANTSKFVDDDPSNYEDSTDSIFTLEMLCPNASVQGKVTEIQIAVDLQNTAAATRSYELSFINPWTAAQVGTVATPTDLTSLEARKVVVGALITEANANTLGTLSEFNSGSFVARDGSNNQAPLRMRLKMDGGSGNRAGVRVRGLTLIVKYRTSVVDLQFDASVPSQEPNPWQVDLGLRPHLSETVSMSAFFGVGAWQKDDGSGTYTGSAASNIGGLADILYHLIGKVGGESVNNTSTTIGNVVDARDTATGLGSYSPLLVKFGTNTVDVDAAVRQLETEFPVRAFRSDGVWQVVPYVMNPHSSRFYRSTSEVVHINGKTDVVANSLRVSEPPLKDLNNKATVRFGHAYGSDKPQGSTSYVHPLGKAYFGETPDRDSNRWDARSIVAQTWGGAAAPAAATALAKYRASLNARPRLTVVVGLSQKFYDLKRGHIVEFEEMESVGLVCPAFRCGRPDYAYPRTTATTTNMANDNAPNFVEVDAGSERSVWMLSQQAVDFTFSIAQAGTYTVAANPWKYYDGSAWQNLAGLVCDDAGSADTVFKRTGVIRMTGTRPNPWSWPKSELVAGSTTIGPGYPIGYDYSACSVRSYGSAFTTVPATWDGRLFEVIEATRKPGGFGQYPIMEAVLLEVM